MTWRLVYASEAGTSHINQRTPCQDRCLGQVNILSDGQPLLSIFAADGAGSALRGEAGAELAVKIAADFVAAKVEHSEIGCSDSLALDLVREVRRHIEAAAEGAALIARDYACTFIGVISSITDTLVMQVGDGGVVIDTGSGLELAITPMTGEYANMTHFVTDRDAVDVLKTKIYPNRALKVAAFTDGIQRIALNLATSMPHEPFFEPFFNGILRASADQAEQLHRPLVRFLSSQEVNKRTDDDKTLAIAVWMPK